jgi:hypothetical protein
MKKLHYDREIKVKVGNKVKTAKLLSEQDAVVFCTLNGHDPLAIPRENVVSLEGAKK